MTPGEIPDDGAERSVPPSLLAAGLEPFWADLSTRLERNGTTWRGTVRLSSLRPAAARLLTTLVGRPERKTIDLDDLESELARLGVGADLPTALASLGHPVSPERAERRARRAQSARTRDAVRAEVAQWHEPWASEWADDVIRIGLVARLDETEAAALIGQVARMLDAIDDFDGAAFSRSDLAAAVAGDAHALDDGTVLERATARALALRTDLGEGLDDPWSSVGAHRSLLVGAAFTWRFPLLPAHPLAIAASTSTDLGVPFVVTRLAVETLDLDFESTADVLVVENPRVIEHAAQTASDQPMVCTFGNPSTTVTMLIDGLIAAGLSLRYHGDFDAAGLEICARMHAGGLVPWKMTSADYLAAIAEAEAADVELPRESRKAGSTPWDPELEVVFNDNRLIIHEERLLAVLCARP